MIYNNNLYQKEQRYRSFDKHIRNNVKECQLTESFTVQKQ